jgi:Putative DNA-binding domain
MLADLQKGMHEAVVSRRAESIAPLLIGGENPKRRLAIHQRNYESSLISAMMCKFPAIAWLLGSPFVTEMSRRFVHDTPPHAPCIAEYGESFPEFLAQSEAQNHVPYIRAFAELEWHVGHVAIAVDVAPATVEEFSNIDPSALLETSLSLQQGVRYFTASWPIDELMKLYLNDTVPDHWQMDARDVWLEIHGSRGQFQINRLEAADFIFRKSIAAGTTIGYAAENALSTDPAFDSGRALASLIVSGLVIGEKQ